MGLNFFPFDNWSEEFAIAKEIGLNKIEFIFNYENYEENPIWQGKGEKVKKLSDEIGIHIKSLCFDYFMRRPFLGIVEKRRHKFLKKTEEL